MDYYYPVPVQCSDMCSSLRSYEWSLNRLIDQSVSDGKNSFNLEFFKKCPEVPLSLAKYMPSILNQLPHDLEYCPKYPKILTYTQSE